MSVRSFLDVGNNNKDREKRRENNNVGRARRNDVSQVKVLSRLSVGKETSERGRGRGRRRGGGGGERGGGGGEREAMYQQ